MFQRSLFFRSLGQVLRRQRLVWWVFGVSFLLAWLGTLPVRSSFGAVLDHSRASAELVKGFDMATFGDLISMPEVSFNTLVGASMVPQVVFVVFMLFIVGGLLAELRADRKLLAPEFFLQAGRFFWRMVRLTLVSLIPFALLGAAFGGLYAWTDHLKEGPSERLGDYVYLGGILVLALVALWVRAWFDVAQARTVIRDERGMFKHAFRSLRGVSFRLYATYLGIGLVRLALVAGAIRLWMNVPAASVGLSFWALELVILAQVATRMWQRAASLQAQEQRGA